MNARPEFHCHIKKSAKHEIADHSYGWFDEFFGEAFEKLKK